MMNKLLRKIGSVLIKRYDLMPTEKYALDMGCGNTPMPDVDVIMDINSSIKNKKLIVHDATKFPYPFKNGTFSHIYCNNILEHLGTDDNLMFKELYRILKIYGKLYIRCPNSLFIYHRLLYFFGIIPSDFVLCHKKHYSFQQMKHNLRNAGFNIFELENLWLFNPFKNFINPHINIIVKRVG